jgi:hypothetical protein
VDTLLDLARGDAPAEQTGSGDDGAIDDLDAEALIRMARGDQ